MVVFVGVFYKNIWQSQNFPFVSGYPPFVAQTEAYVCRSCPKSSSMVRLWMVVVLFYLYSILPRERHPVQSNAYPQRPAGSGQKPLGHPRLAVLRRNLGHTTVVDQSGHGALVISSGVLNY